MKEIKNYRIYGYESHMEICLNGKVYYNNKLFKNGRFNFKLVDKVADNINSFDELKKKIDDLLWWVWDTFYLFEENSKMPLTIKELEDLEIIKKVDNYEEVIKRDYGEDTHKLTW